MQLAIWGTGSVGRKAYAACSDVHEVVCFLDSHPRSDYFYGLNVFDYQEFCARFSRLNRPMIVIASINYLHEIGEHLKDLGLQEGKDFVPFYDFLQVFYYSWWRRSFPEEIVHRAFKKLKGERQAIFFYGNCQMAPLAEIMACNKAFSEKYIPVVMPFVCCSNNEIPFLYERIWEDCTGLVAQWVSDDNRFGGRLSTRKILEQLPKSAYFHRFPNIYFKGYFPQTYSIEGAEKMPTDLEPPRAFLWGDHVVDTLVSGGGTADGIMARIWSLDIWSESEIVDKSEQSLKEMARREQHCAIKIVDYLCKYYRERQLFYAPNHPVNEVLIEAARRLLSVLGFDSDNMLDEKLLIAEPMLKLQDATVYPAVIKALKLREYEQDYLANSQVWNFHGDFMKFQREYLRWRWKI